MSNSRLGYNALNNNTTGSHNIAIGRNALDPLYWNPWHLNEMIRGCITWDPISSGIINVKLFPKELYAVHVDKGQVHREDGPAIKGPNGTLLYVQRDLLHRLDGPAAIQDGKHDYYFFLGYRKTIQEMRAEKIRKFLEDE